MLGHIDKLDKPKNLLKHNEFKSTVVCRHISHFYIQGKQKVVHQVLSSEEKLIPITH